MQAIRFQRWAPYGIAVGSTAIALLLTFLLEPFLNRTIGAFFFVAATVTTQYGGLAPGITAIILSTLAINYFFILPYHEFVPADFNSMIRLAIFFVVAFTISLLNNNLRSSKHKVEQRTQQVLQEQAQFLDLAHDTVMTRDLNSVITFWNHGAEQMYGWTKEEACGQSYHLLLQTQFPQPQSVIEAELCERDYWEGELIHTHRDGTLIVAASRWVLQRDSAGNPVKVLEINNNISEHKRAEAALSQLAAIVESSEDAIISKTLDGRVISWNASAERLFGYSSQEAIGHLCSQLILPEGRNDDTQVMSQLQQGERIQHYETVRRRKDGTLVDVALTVSLVRDVTGNLIGVSKIVRDITPQRAIDRMKTEFISIVSHELRTPLTAIRGSLGLLAAGVYDKKPDKGKRMLQVATDQSDRLVRLVNDILDLGRLESGKVTPVMQYCNAATLLLQSAEAVRGSADQAQIKLSVNCPTLQVWAAPDLIVQTLTNLLSNAIKFSPAGSTIELSGEFVDAIAPDDDKPVACVRFKVHDQGQGIPPDKVDTIFEPFQQVDASNSRQKGGTGLGLAICRKIVQQHGGHIWVDSVVGEGSTVYFTLPVGPVGTAEATGTREVH